MTEGTSFYGGTVDTGWHFIAFSAAGDATSTLTIDGVIVTGDAGANTAAGLRLASGGMSFANVEIAEVRLYTGTKTSAQLAELRNALKV